MKKSDRHRLILDVIQRTGRLRISDIARESGMTEMTIRRDLEALEQTGALSRVHGGAVSIVSQSHSPRYQARILSNAENKQHIGKAAAEQIREGETIILDAGSTTANVARALLGRRNIRVLTVDLRIASELADDPGLTVLLAGGVVRPVEHTLYGTETQRAFAEYNFDTYIMSASGLDAVSGVTEYNPDDAFVKRSALASARRTILVADGGKFGVTTYAKVCGLDDVDIVVTDEQGAATETARAAESAGTRIVST
ncbi:DeoR/GlpR family DNA-binding transcription regulator [Streptosporangium sp. NPDC049046]|uniref:DeoR/GlpR family DNA-binding transcription regulator n=1 Tax=unclassified Streptosporangium TaxID=2632669 RepID=UPI0034195763